MSFKVGYFDLKCETFFREMRECFGLSTETEVLVWFVLIGFIIQRFIIGHELFNQECLTLMEPFHYTKGSLHWKCSLDYMFFTQKNGYFKNCSLKVSLMNPNCFFYSTAAKKSQHFSGVRQTWYYINYNIDSNLWLFLCMTKWSDQHCFFLAIGTKHHILIC